jgi:hypothetical protein
MHADHKRKRSSPIEGDTETIQINKKPKMEYPDRVAILPLEIINMILEYAHDGENQVFNLQTLKVVSQAMNQMTSNYMNRKKIKKIKSSELCQTIAGYGYVSLLKYATENGCPWNIYICSEAAKNGKVNVLKYAHENGWAWNGWTCIVAARFGQLECLKYAHDHGCPWNKLVCFRAAENGHLECLRYAHERGCPWDEETCESASENGHLECVQYIHEHGCPCEHYNNKNGIKIYSVPYFEII